MSDIQEKDTEKNAEKKEVSGVSELNDDLDIFGQMNYEKAWSAMEDEAAVQASQRQVTAGGPQTLGELAAEDPEKFGDPLDAEVFEAFEDSGWEDTVAWDETVGVADLPEAGAEQEMPADTPSIASAEPEGESRSEGSGGGGESAGDTGKKGKKGKKQKKDKKKKSSKSGQGGLKGLLTGLLGRKGGDSDESGDEAADSGGMSDDDWQRLISGQDSDGGGNEDYLASIRRQKEQTEEVDYEAIKEQEMLRKRREEKEQAADAAEAGAADGDESEESSVEQESAEEAGSAAARSSVRKQDKAEEQERLSYLSSEGPKGLDLTPVGSGSDSEKEQVNSKKDKKKKKKEKKKPVKKEKKAKKPKKEKKAKKEKKPAKAKKQKKEKKPAKAKVKKEKAPKKAKKAKGEDESGGGKKKLIIIILVALIAVGGGGFAAWKFGLLDKIGIGGGGSDDRLAEQKEPYVQEEILISDGIDVSDENYNDDWYKVTFSQRYGHEIGEGELEIIEPEEVEHAAAKLAEEAMAETSGEAEAEAGAEEGEEEEGEEGEGEEELSEEEQERINMCGRMHAIDAAVSHWAVSTGEIDCYRTMGSEGYRNLTSEFSQKYFDEKENVYMREASASSGLFSNTTQVNIAKTLLSEDYTYAFVEFTRNVAVTRCSKPELFNDTFLEGIQEGKTNLQKFQLELTYDAESESYLIHQINYLGMVDEDAKDDTATGENTEEE